VDEVVPEVAVRVVDFFPSLYIVGVSESVVSVEEKMKAGFQAG